MSRNIVDVSAPTTMTLRVRTNWRNVRPANVAAVVALPARPSGAGTGSKRCGARDQAHRRALVDDGGERSGHGIVCSFRRRRIDRAGRLVGLVGGRVIGGRIVGRRATGQGEEHLVERRAAQAPRRRSRCRRPRAPARPGAADRCPASTGSRPGGSARRGAARRRRSGASSSPARVEVVGPATRISTTSRPAWRFSSSGVPVAIARPWSTMTTWSASWSASSRYCVVSRTSVPGGDQGPDRVPQLEAAARVEPGRRLVEQQQRRPPPTRLAPGRRGGACRPSSCATRRSPASLSPS